jgi:hypothetical protein
MLSHMEAEQLAQFSALLRRKQVAGREPVILSDSPG